MSAGSPDIIKLVIAPSASIELTSKVTSFAGDVPATSAPDTVMILVTA